MSNRWTVIPTTDATSYIESRGAYARTHKRPNMSDPTQTHYQSLLAPIYRWMLGDSADALERSRRELTELGIARANGAGRALDLGAGLGLQTIPLAELGYRMLAIDTSPLLLAELSSARPDVNCVVGDMRELAALAPGAFDLIVCMGDTLTHLTAPADVDRLLEDACKKLQPEGLFALTFRDYASQVREATDRFILVRADASRILTCCLDYGPHIVQVTDLVHERGEAGWVLRASTYPKLRLSREWVVERLRAHGMTLMRASLDAGRISIVASRPR
jgi:2-polyprenyl-3-methyl-5-hydroxy-6-metoxy-1,4-benzoquinol methylase